MYRGLLQRKKLKKSSVGRSNFKSVSKADLHVNITPKQYELQFFSMRIYQLITTSYAFSSIYLVMINIFMYKIYYT